MIKCPPKNYAFGLLKSGLGEARAHIAYQRNGFEVPEIEKALDLLGMDKEAWRDSKGRTLHQVKALNATAKTVRESGGPILPKSEPSAPSGIAPESKVRVGKDPRLHTVVRELPKSQGDLPDEKFYEVRNDKTGEVQTVESKDITPVTERTAAEKSAVKPDSLDDQLRSYKLDPSAFPDAASKRAALKRAKATSEPAANLGEGLPAGQGSSDAQILESIKGEPTHGFRVNVISRDQAEQITSRPEARGYGGFFGNGEIYFVRENVNTKNPELVRQLLREEIGHGLLRTENGAKLLEEVFGRARRELTEAEKAPLRAAGYKEHQLLDEFIAKSARENRPWWSEVILTIKSWLAKLGLNLSNEDAARLLLRRIKENQSSQIEGVDIAPGQPVPPDEALDEEKPPTIQIAGRTYVVPDETLIASKFTPEQIEDGKKRATAVAASLKLPGNVDTRADGSLFNVDGDSNVGSDGKPVFDYSTEVSRLRDELVKAHQANDEVLTAQLVKLINYNHDEWPKLVAKPLADELRGLAAAKSSFYGQMLRMIKGAAVSKDLRSIARNLDFSLKRLYSANFGGDAYETFVSRIIQNFRDYFTPEQLDKFGTDNPNLVEQVELLAATARAETANRLYRQIQSKLNPKNITPAKLEKNAIAREEFEALIQQLEKIGVDIPEKKNAKMSAREKLLLLVKDKTIEKVNADVEAAIKYGLSEAGKQAARNELLGNKAAIEELDARYLAGEEPTPEQITKGLELQAFRGIKGLRDTWLSYDPVTTKLVQDIVKGDFKGVRFGIPKKQPVDTRLSLTELAKQPDAEITRVLDAYLKNIEDNLDIAGASPETRQRIRDTVQKQVADQIENVIRPKVRDIMFSAPKEKGSAKTDEQKLAEQINAGLFKDERLKVPEMVEHVAGKSLVKKLTPKVGDLARVILDTPSFKQADMEKQIADKVVSDLGVTPDQAENLAKVIYASLKPKITEARAAAQEKAVKSMTPREQAVIPKTDTKLWDNITQFFNAGGKDYEELLKRVAVIRGLPVPSAVEMAKMKALADKIDRLTNLSPDAEEKIRNDSSLNDAEKAQAIDNERNKIEAINASEIGRATRQMAVEWAKFSKPYNWLQKRNIADAGYELATANLLAKFGFPIRLATHITTQLLVRTPIRPLAVALEQFYADRAAGKQTEFFSDAYNAVRETFDQTFKAVPQALRAGRSQLTARGEVNSSRLAAGVNALERMATQAKEYAKKGDYVRATMLYTVASLRMAQRVVSGIDAFQGEFVEMQELRHQIFIELAKQGKSRAEIEMQMENIFGSMAADWAIALADARRGFDEFDILKDSKNFVREQALTEAADRLLKERMYQKAELMGLPSDSMRAYILRQRMAEAWQTATKTGLGGALTKGMVAARQFATEKGLPFLPVEFSNAIGAGVNYHLMLTPFYKLALGKVDAAGVGESAWNETRLDRTNRQLMALAGTMLGGTMAALVLSGQLRVQLHSPTDKKEREKFIAEGHKVGTVEWMLPDGNFIPFSLTVGPFSLVSPYLAAAGQTVHLVQSREKKQAALDAQAAKTGLPAGKIDPVTVTDVLGVAGQAVWASLLGGSTAGGLVSSYSEFQTPNANKAVSATIAPLLPYIPMLQEVSRMIGVGLDSKTATVFDYLLPLPTSGARAINALGDPVRTPDAIQRVIQAITAGTYPGIVSSKPDESYDYETRSAYSALLATRYAPPEINPAKGYAIGGTFRPMTQPELEQYTELRGQYLKENLAALGASATKQQVRAAYQQANAQALTDMGITTARSTAATSGTAAAAPAGQRRLSLGRSRSSGLKVSLKKLHRTKIRRPRSLRLRSSKKSRLHRPKLSFT